jgi:hypothetical protein
VGATGKQPDRALIGRAFGPPFGNQDIRIAFGQFQSVADFGILETDAVDHLGVLANEADGGRFVAAPLGTASILAAIITASIVDTPMSALFATRRLVSGTLPFARAFPVHLWV